MAHLIKIGNSQGIRIPTALVEQAHLENQELMLRVVEQGLLISPKRSAREGWQASIENILCTYGKESVDQAWLDASLVTMDDLEW